jgi:uncharacterized protein (TIGR00266 family)
MMQALVRHRPSFGNVAVTLSAGDEIVAESGAMVSMSTTTRMKTQTRGGLMTALGARFFGGESFFVNRFTAHGPAAVVVLAASTPGDVVRVDLAGEAMNLETGALLAFGPGVKVTTRFAGFRHWIAREGLFKLRVEGTGPAWIAGYGQVVVREIDGSLIVDTGHVLAFEPTLSQTLKLSGGIFSSMFGGEGLVSKFEGRGRLWLQTRNLQGLADWANSQFV